MFCSLTKSLYAVHQRALRTISWRFDVARRLAISHNHIRLARFPFKRKRLRWQAANHGCQRNSCGFRLRNASDCV